MIIEPGEHSPTEAEKDMIQSLIMLRWMRKWLWPYWMFSGSISLIFSRTLISSFAALRHFSPFLVIFRAITWSLQQCDITYVKIIDIKCRLARFASLTCQVLYIWRPYRRSLRPGWPLFCLEYVKTYSAHFSRWPLYNAILHFCWLWSIMSPNLYARYPSLPSGIMLPQTGTPECSRSIWKTLTTLLHQRHSTIYQNMSSLGPFTCVLLHTKVTPPFSQGLHFLHTLGV